MYDFSWKSYSRLVTWVWAAGWLFVAGSTLFYGVQDGFHNFNPEHKNIHEVVLFSAWYLTVSWGGVFALLLLPFGAFAPFAAACSEAYRYERQHGRSRPYAAACGVASMFGLLLVLIPVALVMAVIYAFIWALQQVNGLQLVLGMLAVLGTIAFFWDAIKTRMHLNKLNVFKLSDSRKVIRK